MKIRRINKGWLIGLMLISLLFVQIDTIKAQKKVKKAEDDVEIVCAGDGKTLDEAVKMALRSGLEQTYGTFVSANTTILNDDLIKDEIVSLSTGNVRAYEIVSKNQSGDGTWNAVVKAVFSTGKLVSYVKSKGGSTELEGALFAMSIKMESLNEEAEKRIIQNLLQQINIIAPTVLDFSIKAGEPKALTDYSGNIMSYRLPILIEGKSNDNISNLYEVFHNTMQSLSLTPDEVIKRKELGLAVYTYMVVNGDFLYTSSVNGVRIVNDRTISNADNKYEENWSLLSAIKRSKTARELEALTKKKTVFFFRTDEVDRTFFSSNGCFYYNPTGAFIVSDGNRSWVGDGHSSTIMWGFERRDIGIIKVPKASFWLFTNNLKKGLLLLDIKESLSYKNLEELSKVKEITIKPLRDVTK